jgi:hypothetical protein
MKNTKAYSWVFYLLCLALLSCQKEAEEDQCTNGVWDPGEIGLDCGGVCPPCFPETESTFAIAEIRGRVIQFSNYVLEKHDDWILRFYNDTIDVTVNIGSGDSLGVRPLKALYSKAFFKPTQFNKLAYGLCVFKEIDEENQRMSFFFEASFGMDPNGPNYNVLDSLHVRNGDFENIKWSD